MRNCWGSRALEPSVPECEPNRLADNANYQPGFLRRFTCYKLAQNKKADRLRQTIDKPLH